MTDPEEQTAPARSGEAARALEALRTFSLAYQESAFRLAEWMELPHVDGEAFGEIVWAVRDGHPLSPAILARRSGLTSGATTALINRLERRGLVARSREHDDGRVVTLRPTEKAMDAVTPFIESGTARLAEVLQDYDDDELAIVARFANEIAGVLPAASRSRGRSAAQVDATPAASR